MHTDVHTHTVTPETEFSERSKSREITREISTVEGLWVRLRCSVRPILTYRTYCRAWVMTDVCCLCAVFKCACVTCSPAVFA